MYHICKRERKQYTMYGLHPTVYSRRQGGLFGRLVPTHLAIDERPVLFYSVEDGRCLFSSKIYMPPDILPWTRHAPPEIAAASYGSLAMTEGGGLPRLPSEASQ